MNPLLERIGWAGIVGAACLVVALLLQATASRGLVQHRDQLSAQVLSLQERLRVSGAAGPTRDDSSMAQLARFYAGFPNVQTAADWILRIQQAAQRSGIVLQAGEYRLEPRSAERLQRYAVVLPLRGSYTQIRGFVDAVLAEVPSAALDDIELKRDSAASPALEARIRLTLYLRAMP